MRELTLTEKRMAPGLRKYFQEFGKYWELDRIEDGKHEKELVYLRLYYLDDGKGKKVPVRSDHLQSKIEMVDGNPMYGKVIRWNKNDETAPEIEKDKNGDAWATFKQEFRLSMSLDGHIRRILDYYDENEDGGDSKPQKEQVEESEERKVWLALKRAGNPVAPDEIAKASRLKIKIVYECLDSLLEQGEIEEIMGKDEIQRYVAL